MNFASEAASWGAEPKRPMPVSIFSCTGTTSSPSPRARAKSRLDTPMQKPLAAAAGAWSGTRPPMTRIRSPSRPPSAAFQAARGRGCGLHWPARRAGRCPPSEGLWCSEPALAERVHDQRELRQQVAREQTRIAEALRDAAAGGGVDVNAADGGGIRIRALRDEGGDHTRQDV